MAKVGKTYSIEKNIAEYIDSSAKESNFGSSSNLVNAIFKAYRDRKIKPKEPTLDLSENKKSDVLNKYQVRYNGLIFEKTEGKICGICNDWKPFCEFYKDSSKDIKKDGKVVKKGYMSRCKDCDINKKKKK